MDPTTTAAGGYASTSAGFMALMIGYLGNVGADVMLVILAALSGCVISLSGETKTSTWEAIKFLLISITVSLILAWVLADVLVSYFPAANSPYTPSMIAMLIGFLANRLPQILNAIVNKLGSKAGIEVGK
jgi:hypothetical protein